MSTRRGRPRDEAARSRVLAVGTRRFVDEGYTATMSSIAADAEVAVQTVYQAFGSKVGLLSAVHDVTLAGDDEPVPLLQRGWVRELERAPSVDDAWTLTMEHLPLTTERVAPIYAAIQAAAADPDVAELLARLRTQRLQFSEELAQRLLRRPLARDARHTGHVADVLYAMISPETFTLLVGERGWSPARWRAWLHDTILPELRVSDPG